MLEVPAGAPTTGRSHGVDFFRLARECRTSHHVHRHCNSVVRHGTGRRESHVYDGAVSIGTGVTKNGVATLATSTLAVCMHSITATYAGDATYLTSTSKVVRQVVRRGLA